MFCVNNIEKHFRQFNFASNDLSFKVSNLKGVSRFEFYRNIFENKFSISKYFFALFPLVCPVQLSEAGLDEHYIIT